MNLPKPDSFVMMVTILSEKLAQKEAEVLTHLAHISADHEAMDDMQRTLTDKREECENLYVKNDNLTYDINSLRRENESLRARQPSFDYYKDRCATLEQELLSLKFGGETDPNKRVITYMQREGGKMWADGNKIGCIKGVRECTGWGLKEAKDYSEANGAKFAPKLLEEENGPHTKPSQDMVRKTG